MRTVSFEDFQAHVDQYLRETAQGDLVLTQNGRPWILLRALSPDDDADADSWAHSPEFWTMIQQRRQEQGIPWEEAKKQLDLD